MHLFFSVLYLYLVWFLFAVLFLLFYVSVFVPDTVGVSVFQIVSAICFGFCFCPASRFCFLYLVRFAVLLLVLYLYFVFHFVLAISNCAGRVVREDKLEPIRT